MSISAGRHAAEADVEENQQSGRHSAGASSLPAVHVLLPVHNRIAITKACLEQLLRQSLSPANVVVIDDGSTDGTSAMVRMLAPQATVIAGDGTLWWAGSLREGLGWLVRSGTPGDDIVLILNDDTMFDDRFVENGARAMSGSHLSMLLAQAYSSRTGGLIEVGIRAGWRSLRFEPVTDISLVNCLSTRGLFIRLGDAIRSGGFRPRMLPHYLSDYEFTIRVHRHGVKFITDPAVKLVVNEDATGVRVTDKSSVRAYLHSVFTRRSTSNPIYWTSFLLMACPLQFLPVNLLRVWAGFLRELRQAFSTHGRE